MFLQNAGDVQNQRRNILFRFSILLLMSIEFFLNKTKSMYLYSSKTILSGAIFTELSYGRVLWAINLLLFWGSKITADGDCSREIKRRLLLGRKVMTNLDSIFKSRDITLPTKVCLVKAMVFPVVMYGCESWTVKKAERRRIDALELWCWKDS